MVTPSYVSVLLDFIDTAAVPSPHKEGCQLLRQESLFVKMSRDRQSP